jgi:hypothetical protein
MRNLLVVTTLVLFAGIAYGQTLQKGGIVSIQRFSVTLEPDITIDQFNEFIANKYIPELNKLFEGVKFFALKGERGEHENSFGRLIWIESEDTRNRYWPEGGGASDEFTAIQEILQPLSDEMNKLGTPTVVFTDWLIQ